MPQSKPDELQPDSSDELLAIRQHILNAQNLVHKLNLSDNNPLLIHNNTEIDIHPQDCPACNILQLSCDLEAVLNNNLLNQYAPLYRILIE
mgnify:FL=1